MPVVRIPPGPSCLCAGDLATILPTSSAKGIWKEKSMSTNGPIDLKQDRRQWLKTSATVLGASFLPLPAMISEVAQAETGPAARQAKPGAKSATRFFAPSQHTLVEELSETIIPTDSHSEAAK